ncbi:myosin-M heavy chain [Trichonephila clavata]|uniref:Myosin-M heavy chain n=1 Tax=Trichonephila clavata TaxID=2740835 RepID=A0A8X6J6N1_TRICU|nr:myosin-M heavy chain [Trichonephila clavata]
MVIRLSEYTVPRTRSTFSYMLEENGRSSSMFLCDLLENSYATGTQKDYTTVNIGKLFLETTTMLRAFEVYCVRQGSASVLLTNLEKEKELLRIFLRVSQMENTLLRRMNLSAFLMVPVQRVTKYPLLLNRLYKVTPYHHKDREALREAQLKIELHLEHINQVRNRLFFRVSLMTSLESSIIEEVPEYSL